MDVLYHQFILVLNLWYNQLLIIVLKTSVIDGL